MDPMEQIHHMQKQAQGAEQNMHLARLVKVMDDQAAVMKQQAETAQASQRSAWKTTLASTLIAAGSLAVAILALVIP